MYLQKPHARSFRLQNKYKLIQLQAAIQRAKQQAETLMEGIHTGTGERQQQVLG